MSTRFIIILAIIFILPFLAFFALGGYWLWQQHYFYVAISILSANSLLIYLLIQRHYQKSKAETISFNPIQANQNWTDNGKQAFAALDELTKRWKNESDLLSNANKAMRLTNEVLTTVAQHFHANSNYPLLEFPLPYLLKLISLVCHDIQTEVLDKIPGSHAITISDCLQAKNTLNKLNDIKLLVDVSNALFNLPSFALSKARSILFKKGINYVSDEISQRLVSVYINKLGFYAIQLYSGQITLDDIEPTSLLTPDSKQDSKDYTEHQKTLEPLRVLVLGQVSSGKSSLINALFGEVKTATSILPTTSEITPYILERDAIPQAIILDSAGYGGLNNQLLAQIIEKQCLAIDIILMVCNASNAARHADVAQLDNIRHYFQSQPNQALPVIIAVITHIDRLRPLQQWQPPYNIQNPDNTKAHNIRAVCEVIAKDLNLPLKNIVPVCLNPQMDNYNIEQGLIPMIDAHLNEAQRVRYLRCLRYSQQQSYWQQWYKQAVKMGRLFFD